MIKRVDENGNVRLITSIRKPRKWRRFEYLESSGTLYVDTGYQPNTMTTDMELKFQYLYTNQVLVGAAVSRWATAFCFSTGSQSNNTIATYLLYNGARIIVSLDTSPIYTISYKGTTVNYNGNIKQVERVDLSIPYNIYLFGYNHAGTISYKPTKLRIYEFKLWESNVLVRHMVPAEYNGQYGMWDLVEDKFYGNAGTGTFTVGPEVKNYDEIEEVRKAYSILPAGVELYDYILSSGTLYFDSGWTPDYDKGFEIEAKYNASSSGSRGFVIGSYNASNSTSLEILSFSRFYLHTGNVDNRYNITLDTTHITKCSYLNGSWSHTVDDGTPNTGTVTYTGRSGNTAYMFLDRALRTSTFNKLLKVYYVTVREQGKIILNMLPCTYLGEPGMWDTVENKFYRNQGTGQFTLGNKITLKEYEYLLSDGNLWIDSGLLPTSTTEYTFKISDFLNKAVFGLSNGYLNDIDNNYFRGFNYAILWELNTSANFSDAVWTLGNKKGICNGINLIQKNDTNTGSGNTVIFRGKVNKAIGKIHYFRIQDNNIMLRDFIPVSYNGTPGLWDRVEWKFYANAGSGSFTLGPEKANGIYPVYYSTEVQSNFTYRAICNGLTIRKNTAYINSIKGNTVNYSLIVGPYNTWRSANGTLTTNDNILTYTITNVVGGVSLTVGRYRIVDGMPSHKYYLFIELNPSLKVNAYLGGTCWSPYTGNRVLNANVWNRLEFITNVSSSANNNNNLYISMSSGVDLDLAVGDTLQIRNPFYVDLTLLFGRGSEPTSVEQARLYILNNINILNFLTFNRAQLLNVNNFSIKTVGFNQWDEIYEAGSINGNHISVAGATNDRTKNYIKVIPNNDYYIYSRALTGLTGNLLVLHGYDSNKKGIETIKTNALNSIIHIPYYIHYIKFNTLKNVCTDEICVNLSNTNKNGEYKPYKESFTTIPVNTITGKLNGTGNSIVIFPDGLKKAGNIYDEIFIDNGVTKAIKRVGSVNMGSLLFSYSNNGGNWTVSFFYAEISGKKYSSPNICAAMYAYTNIAKSNSSYPDKGIGVANNAYIYIRNNWYNNVTTFKNEMDGYYINYELDTPEEYVLDNFNLPIPLYLENGGTEQIISDQSIASPTLQIKYTV